MRAKQATPGDPAKAVAYIRGSDAKQALTPAVQRAAITAYAASNGFEVVSWHEETVCSVTEVELRVALTGALAAVVEHGAGILVVAKRDRLARDVVISSLLGREVERLGARVVSCMGEGNGTAPADEFMRTVIDGAAQYERALIRGRTKAALAVLKARGQKTGGGLPYGKAMVLEGKAKMLVPNPDEVATIERARTLRADGKTLRGVAEELTLEGRVSRRGTPFDIFQVRKMLVSS
jgi:DNA invertase Pin-like site-specific DNA recombinase